MKKTVCKQEPYSFQEGYQEQEPYQDIEYYSAPTPDSSRVSPSRVTCAACPRAASGNQRRKKRWHAM